MTKPNSLPTETAAVNKMLIALGLSVIFFGLTVYFTIAFFTGGDLTKEGASAVIWGLLGLLTYFVAFHELRTPGVRGPIDAVSAGISQVSQAGQVMALYVVCGLILTPTAIFVVYQLIRQFTSLT